MTKQSHGAGGQDWFTIWREMYDQERQQAEAATHPEFRVATDFWEGQAERFAKTTSAAPQPDGFMRFLLPSLRPTDTLLDIGAGTGRYTRFLDTYVAEQIALEPSTAMRQQLEQQIGPHTRIEASFWPTETEIKCDIAIAAHVLYGVREIEPFLLKMDQSARRSCYILLGVRHPASYISPFWERLHGTARLPLPGALECLNALYQLGINAELALIPIEERSWYPNEDRALADIRWRLRFPPDPERDLQIRQAIHELMIQTEDGGLRPKMLPTQSVVIWWEHR